ncbi:zinc-ribbon domain-containing protein [Schumannella luteola]
MICSNCATELPPGALFCGECGRPVSARPSPVPAPSGDALAPVAAAPDAPAAPEVEPAVELVAPELPSRAPLSASADWDDLGEEPEPSPPPIVAPPAARLDEGRPLEAAHPETAAPAPTPRAAPDPYEEALAVEGRGAGWCAQCGALMSASDIFCGECGFVRSPAARPRDTAVLDPFPWGISPASREAPTPTPAPVVEAPLTPEPVVPVPMSADPVDEEIDDIDDTRIVSPGARADRFVLQFSTGESVTVSGAGLLGRNPMPEPGEYFDALVTISDPGKSVSKTHLEFGQEGGSFWVSDRYSGNGTIVREPDRPSRRCEPGKRYRIVRGTRVDIGEQFFVVS